jgi:colanic acid biosynthesis glycosyl transferase WcaI
LFYGINFSPELTGIGKYTGDMSAWFLSKNIPQIVVTSFPYYPEWQIKKPYKGRWYKKESHHNGSLIIYRCPMYVPLNPSGMQRILHEFSFLISSGILLLTLLFKRKFLKIICIAPPFHLGLNAILIKFLTGVPFNYHVQDLQVQAAKNLKMIQSTFLIGMMERLQRYIYKNANHISTISHSMITEIRNDTLKEIEYFPNWVDCCNFYPISNTDWVKEKYGIMPHKKILLYAGSVGKKQGLELLLDITKHFKDDSELEFIISGSGPYFEEIKRRAIASKINAIHFLNTIPENEFNAFLNMADIHFIPQKIGTSNLLMPSKLGPILAIGGLALVCVESNAELSQLITKNKMGLVAEAENKESIISQITYFLKNDCVEMKLSARSYALNNLNKEKVLEKYFQSFIS